MKSIVLICICLLSLSGSIVRANASEFCAAVVSGTVAAPNAETEALISYLSHLVERHIIGDEQLLRWFENLNPISEDQANGSPGLLIHRDGLELLRVDPRMQKEVVAEWIKSALTDHARNRLKREDVHAATELLQRTPQFHPIPAGSFEMGEDKVKVLLTHPFEAMTTPVTQYHWAEVMGENPATFVDGERSEMITISGKTLKMQPDHPVESVTWWSALAFANKLSIRNGLRPVYDLSGVKFKPNTRAEDGTLEAEYKRSEETWKIKINAPDGDIYRAQGFRLPTEAEQEYLLRGAGVLKEQHPYGRGWSPGLRDIAWYNENSEKTTHEVAKLRPLIINAGEFYDLYGNVDEWSYDWFAALKGSENPYGDFIKNATSSRVSRGGGWNTSYLFLGAGARSAAPPNDRSSGRGLRLVRTLQ